MRNAKSRQANRGKKQARPERCGSRAARYQNKKLSLEPLETRVLLSVVPQLIDLNPDDASLPSEFVQVGDVAFFAADDGTHGRELWQTDGTPEGTSLVKDINVGSDSSGPRELVEFNGALFFAADDGVNGEELWTSNGTAAGTVMVKDVFPGTYTYFDGNSLLQYPNASRPSKLTAVGGLLFFSAEDATNGVELWMTSGTTAGTALVRDIFPGTFTDNYGTYPNSSNPQDLVNVNGTLFFTADDGVAGRELWRSNGTVATTVLVKDVFPGTYTYFDGYSLLEYPNASHPIKLTAVNGMLFFLAQDEANGAELWKSNGTEAGTVLVKDIRPGAGDAFTSDSPVIAVDGTLFFAADDGVHGDELWKSNGTSTGTVLVKDIEPGATGVLSNYAGFTEVDGTLFFSARDAAHGRELWKTDGTEAGTVLVKDIHRGFDDYGSPNNSYPFFMESVDGTLYFSAFSATSGRELWHSDGTAEGTALVADVVPGDVGLYPSRQMSIDGTLIFNGDDGLGRELWTLDTKAQQADSARLTLFVDGQRIPIPANIGVYADGTTASVFTTNETGRVVIDPANAATLGEFFDVWRTNAGLADDNPDAFLSAVQLLDKDANTTSTVQMFVNGEISTEFDDYVIQDRDEIILIYGSNPVVSLNTNFGPIVIELFEPETPGTVNNFLNYVNDGDYINSLFHRSDPYFVIQAGGFTTPYTTFYSTAYFYSVPTDAQILNEPGISNTEGTVAMAKQEGDPDSATSQFFVNLGDNSLLDLPEYDSFTVFGHVLDMTTVYEIEALPVDHTNLRPFDELPVSTTGGLAIIQSIEGQGDLKGVKFLDDNANGVRDAGEAGLAGVSVFIDANDNGVLDIGEASTTTDADGKFLLQVEPGTYALRAEVSAGRIPTLPVSPDKYTVSVEIGREISDLDFGEATLDPPSGVDLLAATDSGVASDDDLTKLNNATAETALQFQVSGVRDGAEVRIFSDGDQIGSGTASGDTVTVTTDGSTAISDGARNITATQTLGSFESGPSAALVVTIDATPPAAISNTAPNVAQVGQPYTFDAYSPDEGQPGVTFSLADEPAGMAIDEDTGAVDWTPGVDQAVPYLFEIRITDAAGNYSSQTVYVTVLGVIPAYPDFYSVNEDSLLEKDKAAGVLANDGDANSGELSAVVVSQPPNGSLDLKPDGSFTYLPNEDFFGTDGFTYKALEGDDESNVTWVRIEVTGVNDPPDAVADAYTLAEDTELTIDDSQGVLSNDTDPDGDTLTAKLASHATGGLVNLASDGSFRYKPYPNFSGADSFTYTVSDSLVDSGPVTVTLTVTEVPDPPTAVADSYPVNEDHTLTVDATLGVLSNDTDPDGDSLTAVLSTQAANGTVTLEDNGSFTYVPSTDFFGTDSFTYVASDGVNTSAATTVTITVNNQPDMPSAVDDSFTAPNDGTARTLDVLANDTSDPDPPQTLSIKSVTQGTAGGTVTLSNGSISYTDPLGLPRTDTFTYTIEDSDGLTDTATVTVSVVDASDNTLSGFVYLDADADGVRDAGEIGVPGVLITLAGTDTFGTAVSRTANTLTDGSYLFAELPSGTYQLTERQPAAMHDGLDSSAVPGVVIADDQFTNIVLSGGETFGENNFGERGLRAKFISIRLFLASTPPPEVYLPELIALAEELAGNTELAESIRAGAAGVLGSVGENSPVAQNDTYSVDQDHALIVSAAGGVLVNDLDASGNHVSVPGGIAITEINYNPLPPTDEELQADVDLDAGDFEFIELQNVGHESVDLTGIEFTEGITFDFGDGDVSQLPPGETALVVSNGEAFETRYGTIENVAGEFSGSLSDDGEQLTILDALDAPIHQFTYGDADGWPAAADGGGSTLEVVEVTGEYGDPDNWDASDELGGTPGTGTDATVAIDYWMALLVEQPSQGDLILGLDGAFSYTPYGGFAGTDSFIYKLTGGEDDSNEATVTIDVIPAED